MVVENSINIYRIKIRKSSSLTNRLVSNRFVHWVKTLLICYLLCNAIIILLPHAYYLQVSIGLLTGPGVFQMFLTIKSTFKHNLKGKSTVQNR